MEFLTDLWLPILASAAAVFVISSVVHMVIPYHKNDYIKLEKEDRVLSAFRELGLRPGQYVFPCPSSMKDMGSPEFLAKCNQGPNGHMIVRPNGPYPMGKSLLAWFLYSIFVSVVAAYVADATLGAGTSFKSVLRIAGTVATAIYALGSFPESIWKGIRWGVTLKFAFDGLLYGVTTGLIFAALWPKT